MAAIVWSTTSADFACGRDAGPRPRGVRLACFRLLAVAWRAKTETGAPLQVNPGSYLTTVMTVYVGKSTGRLLGEYDLPQGIAAYYI